MVGPISETFIVDTSNTLLALKPTYTFLESFSVVLVSDMVTTEPPLVRFSCKSNPTVEGTATNQNYDIRFGVGPTSYTISPFIVTGSPVCTTAVTYTYTLTPATTYISYSALTFSWDPVLTPIALYSIVLTGTTGSVSYGSSISKTFTVNIFDSCAAATLTPSLVSALTYTITSV